MDSLDHKPAQESTQFQIYLFGPSSCFPCCSVLQQTPDSYCQPTPESLPAALATVNRPSCRAENVRPRAAHDRHIKKYSTLPLDDTSVEICWIQVRFRHAWHCISFLKSPRHHRWISTMQIHTGRSVACSFFCRPSPLVPCTVVRNLPIMCHAIVASSVQGHRHQNALGRLQTSSLFLHNFSQ